MRLPQPDSYYHAITPPLSGMQPVAGDYHADVAILGGGLAGVSTALHLAQAGISVALVEQGEIGIGASGRNGGQVLPAYTADTAGLAARHGLDAARALFALSVDAVDLVRGLAHRHAIDCDLVEGAAMVALKPRQMDALAAEAAMLARDFGYDKLTLWDRDQCRAHVNSDRYIGGLLDQGACQINPLAFLRGLARAAQAAGARLFDHSPVTAWQAPQPGKSDRGGQAGWLHTPRGRITANTLVLAGNAYMRGLVPEIERKIMPVPSCIIATEPLPADLLHALMPRRLAISDANIVLDYFRPTVDGRMLFGGLANYSGVMPGDIAGALRPKLARVFPQLADCRIDYAWGGLIDITLRREPLIGRLAPGVFQAFGFSGHGVALATLAGRVIAGKIAREIGAELGGANSPDTADFAAFDRLKQPDFPGGPFRRAALVLGMLAMRVRDAF